MRAARQKPRSAPECVCGRELFSAFASRETMCWRYAAGRPPGVDLRDPQVQRRTLHEASFLKTLLECRSMDAGSRCNQNTAGPTLRRSAMRLGKWSAKPRKPASPANMTLTSTWSSPSQPYFTQRLMKLVEKHSKEDDSTVPHRRWSFHSLEARRSRHGAASNGRKKRGPSTGHDTPSQRDILQKEALSPYNLLKGLKEEFGLNATSTCVNTAGQTIVIRCMFLLGSYQRCRILPCLLSTEYLRELSVHNSEWSGRKGPDQHHIAPHTSWPSANII